MYSSSYVVIYDACALFGFLHRDVLMQLATAELFHAKWTVQIHDEWIKAVVARRLMSRDQAERIRALMDENVLDCVVTNYEELIPGLTLPDPGDRHVLAAAIRSGAQAIVTFNVADFPPRELQKYDLVAEHPDDFIVNLFGLDAAKVVDAFRAIMRRWSDPPFTEAGFVELLNDREMSKTATALAEAFAASRDG